MNPNIKISVDNEIVYDDKFFGFTHYHIHNAYIKANNLLLKYPVNDKKSFINFIYKSVNDNLHETYFNLINRENPIINIKFELK